jgi:hypothetical protein
MKSRLQFLGLAFVLSGSSILLLFWSSGTSGNIKNGFNRRIADQSPYLMKTIMLNSDLYYFSGWSGRTFYIANPDVPFELVQINDTTKTVVHIDKLNAYDVRVSRISIDSPYFYLADLNAYTIYRGRLGSWKMDTTVVKNKFFSESLAISGSSTILRTLNEAKSLYTLSKEGINNKLTRESSDLIQKQIDGLFCTDGVLLFDGRYNRVLYTYYYRNQFICSDTSLNLQYRGRTIDTTAYAKIKVSKIESSGMTTLASPPAIVNRAAFAHDGMLFINSNLSGDNESIDSFRSSDVIDVYDTSTGVYRLSFYVSRKKSQRIRAFAVHSNELFVLRGKMVEIYKMPEF